MSPRQRSRYMRARRAERVRKGLCTDCPAFALPDMAVCAECRVYQAERAFDSRSQRSAARRSA